MNRIQLDRHIAVLGGGIGGLATAYFLSARGFRTTILEASPRVGGLGATVLHHGVEIDRFYHVLLETDHELLALMDEVNVSRHIEWRPTGMGFHLGGHLYGLNSPLDLLRFGALPVSERMRMAWGALRATRLQRDPLRLDDIPAVEWLRKLFGPVVTRQIWEPLLRAKFGDAAAVIPAYWLWSLLHREKNGGQEVKGYLRGGYQVLADALQRAIVGRGGQVRVSTPVRRLERDAGGVAVVTEDGISRFDAVVSTLPVAQLRQIAGGTLAEEVPLSDLRYQGVVNAVVVSKAQLERYYWTVVVDPQFAFQGVVETTHVISPEWLGRRHLVYLMNYCDAGSDTYQRPEELVQSQAMSGLKHLYPGFKEQDVEEIYVFRAPYVEPVWSLGYTRKRPPYRLGKGFYMSTTAQAYPQVTAWNTSIGLAREAVEAVLTDTQLPVTPSAAERVATPESKFEARGRWGGVDAPMPVPVARQTIRM